jgi:lipopolysaccharide transport system permease protein
MKTKSFREIWKYRELLFFLAWRDVKIRYRQTALGAAWAVIQPLFTMLVFTLLFGSGKITKIPSEGIPYPIFAYSALLLWTYFAVTLGGATSSLIGNSDLIRKVYFPRAALPASAILANLLDLLIAAVFLLLMMGYYRVRPSWGLLFVPLLILELVIFAFGGGLILAALNVKYRDIKHALPFVMQLWMFLTPIIYPISAIPQRFRTLMALNPLAGIVETMRACVFPSRHVDWHLLGVSLAVTLVVSLIGITYFRRAERGFGDII